MNSFDSKMKHKGPKAKFNAGAVQVAVWENEGKEGTLFETVTIDKRYKVGDEWKSWTDEDYWREIKKLKGLFKNEEQKYFGDVLNNKKFLFYKISH